MEYGSSSFVLPEETTAELVGALILPPSDLGILRLR